MDERFRDIVIEALRRGEPLPTEWARELFPPEKKEVELVYHGKEREEEILADTMAVPLQPVRTFGKKNGWENMLIFGDNLQAMRTLLEMKRAGKLNNADGTSGVKLVYIDPPFASNQEFKATQEEKAYRDKILGARFIEFLRSRLVLIRELLAPDGSLFLHLDQRKVHYAKVVLDEVFGEHNFRNEIIVPGRASKNLQQQFAEISRLNVRHDTVLWYSGSSATRFAPLWIEKHDPGNPEGHWHHFWSTADRPSMRYELFGHRPKSGQWTWQEKRAKQAVRNYDRYLREAGGRTLAEYWRDTGSTLDFVRKSPDDGKPQYWRAPSEIRLADTLWAGVPVYSNSTGYPTEKNEALLTQILTLAAKPGDLVLDAFAGSGTTAAVAERLGYRWIAIDCGKLSIYTIQKRLLHPTGGNSKKVTIPTRAPFALYNAGLYDFTTLRRLPWEDWRFFALQLFGCRDEPHKIGRLKVDGKLKGSSVLVFNHHEHVGKRIDEDTVRDIHLTIGKQVGSRFFIIAPRGVFDFQQDYLDMDGVRYYALRIPYSIINELHARAFTVLRQPRDEANINDTVDAVGFDFIRPPEVQWKAAAQKAAGTATLTIKSFGTSTRVRGEEVAGGFDAFAMLMMDFDYDDDLFEMDQFWLARDLKDHGWRATFDLKLLGAEAMAVFIDIYGNESRVVIPRAGFGLTTSKPTTKGSGKKNVTARG
jgi:DNA modification methylase